MIRDFSKDEMEGAESGHDTELTLGGGTLFVLASGLLVLCTSVSASGTLLAIALRRCRRRCRRHPETRSHSPYQPVQAPSLERPGSRLCGLRQLNGGCLQRSIEKHEIADRVPSCCRSR